MRRLDDQPSVAGRSRESTRIAGRQGARERGGSWEQAAGARRCAQGPRRAPILCIFYHYAPEAVCQQAWLTEQMKQDLAPMHIALCDLLAFYGSTRLFFRPTRYANVAPKLISALPVAPEQLPEPLGSDALVSAGEAEGSALTGPAAKPGSCRGFCTGYTA